MKGENTMKRRYGLRIGIAGIIALTIFTIPQGLSAAWGDLDTGFGSGGMYQEVSTRFTPYGIAVQADGKILVTGKQVSGNGTSRFFLRRYLGSGQLDTGFGTAGGVTGSSIDSIGLFILVMADGKIVVSGGAAGECAIWRFSANGTPDIGFGSVGLATFSNYLSCQDIAVQNNKLIGTGFILNKNDAVFRLNTDGTIDPSFGTNGETLTNIRHVTQLIVESSSARIVIAGNASEPGTAPSGVTWQRLYSNGGDDFLFLPGSTSPCGQITGLVRQSTGKFIMHCSSADGGSDTAYLFRYNSNGTMDFVPSTIAAWSGFLGIQKGGKVVTRAGGDMYRYDTDLNLEQTFPVSPTYDLSTGSPWLLTLQSDNKLIFAGRRDGGKLTMIRALAN